jgi:hypothetical protein
MQEILIDRGELGFQHFVENGNDFCVAFHRLPLLSSVLGSQFSVLSSQ